MIVESDRIELKVALNDTTDIEKEVVAFLNSYTGGIVYIGISDDGNVVGVKDIDGDMLKLKDRIRNGVKPSPMGLFDIIKENIEGKDVIKLFVASGSEKPYYKVKYGMSTRGCFLRIGTAAEPMDPEQIEYEFSHRVRNSLGRIRSPRLDLTFAHLKIYYEEGKKPLNDNYLRTLELLNDDGHLNYVAYLLADENGMPMKVAKYKGKDRTELISNNEYGYCSLITATRKVLDKFEVENQIRSTITPTKRIDVPLWDKIAMREAIVNAIVHNDYTNEIPPKFELFSDRVEITCAGKLPQGLDLEGFFSGVSVPRNKELMRVFRDLNLVESLGSGMPKILKNYPRENFNFIGNFLRITFPYNWIPEDDNRKESSKKITENVTENATENVTENATENVTENATEKVTENATGKVTEYVTEKVAEKVAEAVAEEDTENATEKAAENVTENATENVTENETKNVTEKVAENATENATKKVTGKVTKNRIKIIELLIGNPNITQNRIAQEMGISRQRVNTYMSELQEMGIIQHVGPDKGGHWEVLKK